MATRLSRRMMIGAAALLASPGFAQLLPSVGGGQVGGAVGGVVGGVSQSAGDLGQTVGNATQGIGTIGQSAPAGQALSGLGVEAQQGAARLAAGAYDRVETLVSSIGASSATLLELRRMRLAMLIDAHRKELDSDKSGNPVRRDRLIAVEPTAAQLAGAMRAGFRVEADQQEPNLGLRVAILAPPARERPRKALEALRRAAPGIDADYDHVFEPAGGALSPTSIALATSAAGLSAGGSRIAMVDGGVASHPALAAATIEQRGFAGSAEATGHGTAVASLLVGNQGAFRGAARGASLFVADVYGGNPAAGSASTIIRALGWAASKKPRLINISLVGPANRAIERAIGLLRARGIAVVASVGNDGPAAPAQYPASYEGVIAVTGVDSNGKALIEAGRAKHLDFAAPGADMVAALPGTGYAAVRGTSFASPLAAARLAATGSIQGLAAEARPGKGKVGRGIVCGTCALSPKALKSK